MIRAQITIFEHTFEAAKQVRDAINASVPGAAVTVEQVLSDAAAKGVDDYLKAEASIRLAAKEDFKINWHVERYEDK